MILLFRIMAAAMVAKDARLPSRSVADFGQPLSIRPELTGIALSTEDCPVRMTSTSSLTVSVQLLLHVVRLLNKGAEAGNTTRFTKIRLGLLLHRLLLHRLLLHRLLLRRLLLHRLLLHRLLLHRLRLHRLRLHRLLLQIFISPSRLLRGDQAVTAHTTSVPPPPCPFRARGPDLWYQMRLGGTTVGLSLAP
jgi:hypothetical protein